MLSQTEIKDLIIAQGVLPLYYTDSEEVSANALRAFNAAGITVTEYTNRGNNALSNFKELKDVCGKEFKDMCLGAGTIKSAEAANAFIEAGAEFLVSPAWVDEIYDVCIEKNILWIPGCMTSTEIAKAEAKGITLIKIFPGNILGPAYIKALKEIFPSTMFMPTGGVEIEYNNLSAWFKAGVVAVGLGSKLASSELLAAQDYNRLTQLTTEALNMVKEIKA